MTLRKTRKAPRGPRSGRPTPRKARVAGGPAQSLAEPRSTARRPSIKTQRRIRPAGGTVRAGTKPGRWVQHTVAYPPPLLVPLPSKMLTLAAPLAGLTTAQADSDKCTNSGQSLDPCCNPTSQGCVSRACYPEESRHSWRQHERPGHDASSSCTQSLSTSCSQPRSQPPFGKVCGARDPGVSSPTTR